MKDWGKEDLSVTKHLLCAQYIVGTLQKLFTYLIFTIIFEVGITSFQR